MMLMLGAVFFYPIGCPNFAELFDHVPLINIDSI